MPFYEVWLTLHGRSSAPRWRRIGSHAGLAAVILAALGGELWFLADLPLLLGGAWRSSGSGSGPPATDPGLVADDGFGVLVDSLWEVLEFVGLVVAVPCVIIASLCIGLQLLKLTRRGTPGE